MFLSTIRSAGPPAGTPSWRSGSTAGDSEPLSGRRFDAGIEVSGRFA
ncbi:hypothetical protein XA26_16970 [Mycolicibacterium fortuitum]|uniref:Uncharacterized protein n=1 Tax=Mycolicibacterium fortuitum TaxID=1766 RepID=A0A0N9YEH6_MYCFO|nr:hypothetical protein G155_00103 [Mycobacterium sp. VKM Ac-1817D]ALI25544.1 hypothetical protein XA26_16970 [Mycolicibacterium fortuitum]